MSLKKIAVFSTSDIVAGVYTQALGEEAERHLRINRRKFGAHKYEDATITSFSTGLLEKALDDGYKVYVVSTREKLHACDDWWVALLSSEQIYLSVPPPSMEEWMRSSPPDEEEYNDITEMHKGSAWHKLYTDLGLEYPHKPHGGPVFWTEARWGLNHMGVKLGHEFQEASDA